VIKTAVTNSELHSEAFDNAYYSRAGINAFGSGSVANAIAAPNGSLTADFITEDTTAFRHRLAPVGKAVVSGITYTYSIYAKSTNRNLFLNCDALFNARSAFNLQTGVVTVGNGSGAIEPVGDGWYRCSITGAATSTKTDAYYIQIQTGTVDQNYTGDNTSGIYLWGAQLEQSSTVGEYIPTTSTINSAPRFDHNPTTGESLGLLVEEQRTNLLVQSNQFDTTWSRDNATVTAASAASPAGISDGWLFSTNTATSNHNMAQAISWTATAFTLSFYAKYNTHQWIGARIGPSGNQFFGSWDLLNGATGSATVGATIGIQNAGGGWYRLTLTATLTSSAAANAIIALNNSDVTSLQSYTGTATGSYIWGAQLEAGAFPTSYIPTTTATVTRSADVASIGSSAFSGFYNQSEGTVFAETSAAAGSGNFGVMSFNASGSGNNRIDARIPSLSLVTTGGTQVAALNNSLPQVAGQVCKTALAYAVDNYGKSTNGSTVATDTSGAMPVGINQLDIGSVEGRNIPVNQPIRRLTFWPTRLPNSTLQAVTQ
jgi:hypothetical protein